MCNQFSFTVHGDPVPYLRMTQAQVRLLRIPDKKLTMMNLKKKNQVVRYLRWKEYVRFFALPHNHRLRAINLKKPKVRLDVMVFFRSLVHGDPDNIRKGIQDALFSNDKYVMGCVDYDYDTENPRCEVAISFNGETA